MSFITFLKNRLREPSSWAGFGLLFTVLPQAIATKNPVEIITAITGIVSVLVPEAMPKSDR